MLTLFMWYQMRTKQITMMITVMFMVMMIRGGEKYLFIVGVLGTRSLDEVSGRDDLRLVLPGTHYYQNDHR